MKIGSEFNVHLIYLFQLPGDQLKIDCYFLHSELFEWRFYYFENFAVQIK